MGFTVEDLSGQRFGRLVAISLAPREQWRKPGAEWLCACDCGVKKVIQAVILKSGDSNSCGCLRRQLATERAKSKPARTHGLPRDASYNTWKNMKQRCSNAKNPDYEYWGGRGIQVCERWLNSYQAFLEDMGQRPSSKHSIDRRNNDGDYEPSNCYWATPVEQANNRRPKRR